VPKPQDEEPISCKNIITVGAVESLNSRNVFSMYEYRVRSVEVNIGDSVKAGDVLAILAVPVAPTTPADDDSDNNRNRRDIEITSPIDGTVTAVLTSEGEIGTGILFVVEDTTRLRVVTTVREQDISRIRTGMEVNITSDATGNAEYKGTIGRISPAAKVDSPVVEFEVEVIITSDRNYLRIGSSARVEIVMN
jgi:multidrug efflux pump subunit AcrA (membrane-fusion protein)